MLTDEVIYDNYEEGYLRVRVKWTALWYYPIAGLYRNRYEVLQKINKLAQKDPRWSNVHFYQYGVHIFDGNRKIAEYNYQSHEYVGRPFLKPLFSLPIFSKIYYRDTSMSLINT